MKNILIITSVVFCSIISLSSCKKYCYCSVTSPDGTLPSSYNKVLAKYVKEKECPNFKDEDWDKLGYTYTCAIEE